MRKFTDVSIDLETLGTKAGCVITQIGLFAFDAHDPDKDPSSAGMRIHVNPQSGLDHGMTVSWSTIAWWLQQSEEARIAMATAEGEDLVEALMIVNDFFDQETVDGVRVWGNGATFDISLLDAAYTKMEWDAPWAFRNIRDLRTLYDLPPCKNVERLTPDVAHDALADAACQGLLVYNCMKALKHKE